MTLFHIALVAIVQGITEFLPISSSGHLILLPQLTGLEDQGLLVDVSVHFGTLFAVVLFFWPDMRDAILGLPRLVRGRADTPGARLALYLILATIPVLLAGGILHVTGLLEAMRSIAVIGWTMLLFGLLLWWVDQRGGTERDGDGWTWKDALIMGLWQILALIPGTSRSGITITAARHLGYDRESAARLAMLMSVPVILGGTIFFSIEAVLQQPSARLLDCVIAAALAFLAALAALKCMMMLLKSLSFTPYVVYRVALGIVLLAVAYS
ncbi:Undecaprenyl-diphosphatase [Salinihabitans flavidus]|uniref:Undecaprenyl-diphosphatase n=1 Tax=Salinihabitans flavidus TaxID=569882 RepID=A0A1H8R0F2_9RHOB|nr:undecaprenyl-diphosphate phosphatase [Salinihabitans flavidus]SEO59816.1 Undecaprenyl-diphosphatase [Salinihabitans flavidus]